MHIDFPHRLSQAEAKARLQALGDYLQNKHGIGVTWQGESARIQGRYMVVSIDGTVDVGADKVVFDGKDPGMLWRKKAKDYLTHKLGKYLDPSVPADQLPRR
ncbi:polyhydroxyalkanoic acid system family protein [Vulgatibacter sp.]|uniref:polyhydroxyalkanoic acid system family protein n=1 Tax=Vulgatibacter sp. TaxID=1971226 RepID=UPI00356A8F40